VFEMVGRIFYGVASFVLFLFQEKGGGETFCESVQEENTTYKL
jgi:hypothetical protein